MKVRGAPGEKRGLYVDGHYAIDVVDNTAERKEKQVEIGSNSNPDKMGTGGENSQLQKLRFRHIGST